MLMINQSKKKVVSIHILSHRAEARNKIWHKSKRKKKGCIASKPHELFFEGISETDIEFCNKLHQTRDFLLLLSFL